MRRCIPRTRWSPARRACGTRCRTICRSRPGSAIARRPTGPSRRADHVVNDGLPHRPRHRRAAGAARRARAITTPRPAATRFMPAAAARCARSASSRRARHRRPTAARALLRRRRQFRHPQPRLRRIRPGAVGGAQARPAGEVHGDALGSLPQRLSGPRSRHQGRAGAARGRPVPRDARHQYQQCRRALRCRCRRSARAPA